MNPNRECRMCKIVGNHRTDILRIAKLVPNYKNFEMKEKDILGMYGITSYPKLDETLNHILPKIRSLTQHCPNCLLSVLRQSGIPMYLVNEFNYKEEVVNFWKIVNSEQDDSHLVVQASNFPNIFRKSILTNKGVMRYE